MMNRTPGCRPSPSGRVRYASAVPSAVFTSMPAVCMAFSLEELADAVHHGAADDDLQQHPADADHEPDNHDDDVLEQHAKRQQDYAQRGKRVQPCERRTEERAGG